MRLSATQDVSEAELAILAHDLRGLVDVEVDEARTFYKSVEPPSWIALVEHLPTWAAVLGPSAAIFLGELVKEGAKDLYRNKTAVARVLTRPLVAPLRAAAAAIMRFRSARARTDVEVGLPVPDDYFGTRLRLEGRDEDTLALELALFIKHAGGIQAVLDEAQRGGARVVGQITLTLLPDGSLHARWMDRAAEVREVTLLPPAV